jgi:hypothetical protein
MEEEMIFVRLFFSLEISHHEILFLRTRPQSFLLCYDGQWRVRLNIDIHLSKVRFFRKEKQRGVRRSSDLIILR